jgi:hypothetical protein
MCVAIGCVIGGTAVAGYSAAAAYVANKIAALRAKHHTPARPSITHLLGQAIGTLVLAITW